MLYVCVCVCIQTNLPAHNTHTCARAHALSVSLSAALTPGHSHRPSVYHQSINHTRSHLISACEVGFSV